MEVTKAIKRRRTIGAPRQAEAGRSAEEVGRQYVSFQSSPNIVYGDMNPELSMAISLADATKCPFLVQHEGQRVADWEKS